MQVGNEQQAGRATSARARAAVLAVLIFAGAASVLAIDRAVGGSQPVDVHD